MIKKCYMCGELQDLVRDYDLFICKKCNKISLSGIMDMGVTNKYYDAWSFILNKSITEKGVEWYKIARDKLIIKLDKRDVIQNKKEKERNNKIVREIEKW